MKLLFSFFLFLFCTPLVSKNFIAEYSIKVKGISIGKLAWDLSLSNDSYEMSLDLVDRGFLSNIYSFNGSYSAIGKIENKQFIPRNYTQLWVTKKKKREVEIYFENQKITKLILKPNEDEIPRIDFKKIHNYLDPLSSFLKIIIYGSKSYTIDGRRTYLLWPKKEGVSTKISIQEYTNIWADHKRNDLEFIEIFQDQNHTLPKKIKIKFKGIIFVLNKV